jgi:hypothetical protein
MVVFKPPFYSLRQILMTHACPSRITAAAGTRFAGTIQGTNVIILIPIEQTKCLVHAI